ncbi:hypothetical protein JOD20_003809 [Herpetosiphon giganteus]|nr:hypothetical protein [Herpetosiphon giganteus]
MARSTISVSFLKVIGKLVVTHHGGSVELPSWLAQVC